MRKLASSALALLLTHTAQAQYAFHFEFDQPGVLPTATAGVGAYNNTGSPTTTLFQVGGGVLRQRTNLNPILGAGFYAGSLGSGYPTVGTGLDPNLPAFAEARFRVLGGSGGSATIPNSTGVMGLYPGANVALVVNMVSGQVGLLVAGGMAWVTPAGGYGIPHTYRLESQPIGGGVAQSLYIDGFLAVGPVLAQPVATNFDGWHFGDGSGSPFVSTSIDWDYVSIGQATPGPGQVNSQQAALFVNRSNTSKTGQMGLKGPFTSVVQPGSSMVLEWNGPPNSPFFLFTGSAWPAYGTYGCAGIFDLAPTWTLIFDPTAPGVGPMFFTDATGYARQTLLVPASLPPGIPLLNLQGFLLQTSGCPLELTAGHYLTT